METQEFTGKTVRDALDAAAAAFGVPRDDLEYEVISEGRAGILGFGAEDARIRVVVPSEEEYEEVSDEEVIETLREIVSRLLALMQIEATIAIVPTPPSVYDSSEFTVNISGGDLGVLIGRRGETLAALQFIVNLMLAKRLGVPVRVAVDVEQYRERRMRSIQTLALRAAERVAETNRPITLEAMPPNERRIVHLALREHPTVTSQSIGEGDSRKVMVLPRR
ncbi:MAG: RNA-binding cell elongation regulator Jag/EloR [Chloroflexota bacterium]|nr:protein jag [Dehalococcoidia bacterium]MDW8254622.1 RNA-binding cell elongation regulator Jag/EloR [Chloroflexota bacterium]